MSFYVEVTDGSGYARNGLVFATEEDAKTYALDLLCRWTAARDYRIVETSEEPNR